VTGALSDGEFWGGETGAACGGDFCGGATGAACGGEFWGGATGVALCKRKMMKMRNKSTHMMTNNHKAACHQENCPGIERQVSPLTATTPLRR